MQLIGPHSLSDYDCTIVSSNEKAEGSASTWITNVPSKTQRQLLASLSVHEPKNIESSWLTEDCVNYLGLRTEV